VLFATTTTTGSREPYFLAQIPQFSRVQFRHSYFNATMGSTRIARRAGK
jgi:hypothetical protein